MSLDYDGVLTGAKKTFEIINKDKFDSILFIWLYEYVETTLFKIISSLAKSVFIICEESLYKSQIEPKFSNFFETTVKNKLIREPNDIFDLAIYIYTDIDASVIGLTRKELLKESVRVVKKGSHIIITNFKKLSLTEDDVVNRLITMYNSANSYQVSSKEEFIEDFTSVGITEIEIIPSGSLIIGLGTLD